MNKHPLALAGLLIALLLPGCGSFITWSDDFEEKLPENQYLVRVYSGVLWDLNVMDPSTSIGQPPDEDPEEPYFTLNMSADSRVLMYRRISERVRLPDGLRQLPAARPR